jgi:hypothetical protein
MSKKAGVRSEFQLDHTPAELHTGRNLGGSCLGVPAPGGGCFCSRLAAFLLRFLVFPACSFGRFVGAGHQFYQGHRRRISMPPADFDDSSITAGAILEARGDRVEQLMDDGFVLNDRERLAPGMEATLFAKRNNAIHPASELFGLGIGGLYLLFPQQGSHHVAHHRPAVTRVAAKLSS